MTGPSMKQRSARQSTSAPGAGARTQYAVPAVEKALELIELLASQAKGLTLVEIAAQLQRSMGEIYRVAIVLAARGVIVQEAASERYFLTGKLFELAHRHPPTARLLDMAEPLMRTLAERMEQSCHLAVLDRDAVLIVACAESPLPMNYRVRVGVRFPALETSSGVVLVAHQPRAHWERWMAHVAALPRARLQQRLEAALAQGAEEMPSPMVQGVTNLSYAVRDHRGMAVAALTVPFLSQSVLRVDLPGVRPMVQQAAGTLSAFLGFVSPANAP
ncbi:IclR family transcriptional regulator [Verminephrobacter aporrectodeae subsp. tuberculatae]|nr:IclR family transcriptional regulator [Verminephrobacter aporrectodeae subsp. tuberculatae]